MSTIHIVVRRARYMFNRNLFTDDYRIVRVYADKVAAQRYAAQLNKKFDDEPHVVVTKRINKGGEP